MTENPARYSGVEVAREVPDLGSPRWQSLGFGRIAPVRAPESDRVRRGRSEVVPRVSPSLRVAQGRFLLLPPVLLQREMPSGQDKELLDRA